MSKYGIIILYTDTRRVLMFNCSENSYNDLLIVVLPVMITAIASLIVTIIQTIQKSVISKREYNYSEYQKMGVIYPKLKNILTKMFFAANEIESLTDIATYPDTIIDFYLYKEDKAKFREKHPEYLNSLAQFEHHMSDYIETINTLNAFLATNSFPMPPMWHPILKKKIVKMLSFFQYYSLIIDEKTTHKISNYHFKQILDKINTDWGNPLSSKFIANYIDILNEWVSKY